MGLQERGLGGEGEMGIGDDGIKADVQMEAGSDDAEMALTSQIYDLLMKMYMREARKARAGVEPISGAEAVKMSTSGR